MNDQKECLKSLSQNDVKKLSESVKTILSDPPTSYLSEATGIWNRILEDVPQDYIIQV